MRIPINSEIWMLRLKRTVLHPQWLVLRGEAQNRRAIARSLRGRILDIGCGNQPMEALLGPDTAYVGLDYPRIHAKR